MLSLAAKNMNTSYIQNNYYGRQISSIPMFVPNFVNAPVSSNLGGWNSVFSMPMMGCCHTYPLYPSIPFFSGGFMPPFSAMWGGCCSGARRFFDMMMTMQLFQSTMNALSKLSNRNNSPSASLTYSDDYPNMTQAQAYSEGASAFDRAYAKPRTDNAPTFNYSSSPVSKTVSANRSSSINTNTNLPQLKEIGYNAQKGENLARAALSNARGFNHSCALYVRMALQKAGLYNGMKADGADYDYVLRNNSNFREISSEGVNLSTLPAGCILVYARGTAGYSSEYGHVEITTGSGQAVSDGITDNIRPGAKIFVPV